MSKQQGSGGLGPAGYIPPGGSKRNDGGRPRKNKYRDVKPSEQKATSGQRRARRMEQ